MYWLNTLYFINSLMKNRDILQSYSLWSRTDPLTSRHAQCQITEDDILIIWFHFHQLLNVTLPRDPNYNFCPTRKSLGSSGLWALAFYYLRWHYTKNWPIFLHWRSSMSVFFIGFLHIGWTNSCMVQLQWSYLPASLPKWNRKGLL